jgi:hypothetical protein
MPQGTYGECSISEHFSLTTSFLSVVMGLAPGTEAAFISQIALGPI